MKRFIKKLNRKYVIFFLISVILISLPLILNKALAPEELKYTEFLEMVEKGEIEEIDLMKDSEVITVTTVDDVEYLTNNPRSDEFKENMLKKNISVVSTAPLELQVARIFAVIFQIGFLLVIVVIILTLGRSSFTDKSKLASGKSKIKFEDIAGNVEAKSDMEFLVKFLKKPKDYHNIGAKLPKGVILYGPPGTGKTLMAKAVAGEAGVPFYYASGSDFIEMYVGLGAKRVRSLFKKARENSPCIVFIDEIDAIGAARGGKKQSSENDQTIQALLTELDGFDSKEQIIVIAATNRLEDLDSALIRPGRFDRQVNIGLPDVSDRQEMLKSFAKNKDVDENIDFESLANITMGMSGASLESLMNEAAIIAVNNGSSMIKSEHIDDAYFKIVMKGNKKVNKNKDEDEVKLVAYHEAGHALVTSLLTDNHIHKVTIIPSTSGAGGALLSTPKKSDLITKRQLLNNVMILYAGRASEEILRGNKEDITSGASSDIKQATNLINAYFSELGMSEKFGMMAIDNDELYLDEAVKLSNQLYKDTINLLIENKSKLSLLAETLLVKETLTGKEVEKLLSDESQ